MTAAEVGLPDFDPGEASGGDVFDLSSHQRAREALEFGLGIADSRFNVFVLGEEQSGRLTSTLAFVKSVAEQRPQPDDWVYLNSFQRPAEPRPYRLPAGVGYALNERMVLLVRQLREALGEALTGDEFRRQMQTEETRARETVNREMEALRAAARAEGVDILQTPQGAMITVLDAQGQPVPPAEMTPEQEATVERVGTGLSERLGAIMRQSVTLRAALQKSMDELGRAVADQASAPLLDELAEEYGKYRDLSRWIVSLRNDIVENFATFLAQDGERPPPPARQPERRYAVNLLVDNRGVSSAPVVLEPNPSHENLFGRIEYRRGEASYDTDFTMIRAGALHRANGGVLVLRADAVAAMPGVWGFLKAALRDGEIRIEEPHRSTQMPVAGEPKPVPIPLSIKVVMVASPHWYYTFYSVDPEFQSYFKVKADIDPDMDATPDNQRCYGALIRGMATSCGSRGIDDDAVRFLLGIAARRAADRGKLSSQFERIEDVVVEACRLGGGDSRVTRDLAVRALENRRRRNSRVEDRVQEAIARGTVLISSSGAVVGQINALTVRDTGDHSYGAPSRVTARASAGRHGVINIEREAALGGPIQQKGAMVLQGFLSGRFARRFPLSFNCSITFEQSYGGVEGDSASLAELLAILSDLSGLPLRQDLAITGSVNQLGEAQAIGGAHHKIEGFFRTCSAGAGLTGTQGVVVPAANERNLVLHGEVAGAIARGRFHIYSVSTVDEAVAIFTGVAAGEVDPAGAYPPDLVYGRVMAQLEAFDSALMQRIRSL